MGVAVAFASAACSGDGEAMKTSSPTGRSLMLSTPICDRKFAANTRAAGDDFSATPELGLPQGSIDLSVSAARLDGFSFDQLRYNQMSRAQWTAYAIDTFTR
jgi:hypothetical protein